MTPKSKPVKTGGPKYVTRIWHRGCGRYLYAKDYGIKGFPLGNR